MLGLHGDKTITNWLADNRRTMGHWGLSLHVPQNIRLMFPKHTGILANRL